MQTKISKRSVDASKPGSMMWDSELKGFGLRCSEKGARSYVLKYRHKGQQRWFTIGRHGAPWTPEQARKEALRLLGLIASGSDPATARREDRLADTVVDFAARYFEEYAAVHKKPKTYIEERRTFDLHGRPVLGNLKITDVTREHIKRIHVGMRNTPYQANRFLAVLRHMFNIAEDWGLRPTNSNPCTRIKKYEEKARERFLSPRELSKLGRVLSVVDAAAKSPYEAAAIRLLLFTGARLSEILTLQWSYVDLDARALRLPDSKTGAKTVALPPPAVEVLNTLPRQAGNPYVICGHKDGAHLVNLQKPWRRIRKAAGLNDVRIHDLRHSFASIALSRGLSLSLIGSLLGHSQTQTTARYAHLHDAPRQAAAEQVANEIAARLSGGGAKIVALRASG